MDSDLGNAVCNLDWRRNKKQNKKFEVKAFLESGAVADLTSMIIICSHRGYFNYSRDL